jgi:hypothetical protein
MDKKLPPRIQFNIVDDYDDSNHDEPILDESEEDFESYEDEIRSKMPEIVEKPKPVKEDIFDLPNLAVRPDYLDDYLDIKELTDEETPKAPRKKPKQIDPGTAERESQSRGKKQRKPMSEEHKAKLALAREKAMAVRKANAIEKKKMKELDNEEKELLKKQKVKKVQKLKESVEKSDEEEIKPITKIINNHPSITKKDLEEAQFEAISKYENLRKSRKAEKKKQQEIDKQKADLINKLKQPQHYKYRDGSNPWDRFY